MTTRHKLPPTASQGPARQLFDALSNIRSLEECADSEPKIALSRLYRFATTQHATADLELERLLDRDLGLRRDFRRLVAKTAAAHMPRVAAASSGEISQRSGTNCRIRFEPSRAEPDQVYVIIEFLGDAASAPGVMFVCDADDRCDKILLPKARDGIIQLLLEQECELLTKLRDIDAEIYLG